MAGVLAYAVSAHKPTTVTHSVVGHFTSPEEQNLVVAKCTRIEIHLLTPDGLQSMLDVPIYGRISAMQLFRPPGEQTELLFILTERCKFCVLKFDAASGELVTRASGDAYERIGKPTEAGQICVIDPECRMIGLHLYDGSFKVIPINPKGQLQEAFNIRLEELQVIDLTFLHGAARPTIAVLYQDTKEARHLKTYEVSVKDKDFVDGPWQHSNLDAGASIVIPIPSPLCGVVVVGENSVAYLHGATQTVVPIRQSLYKAFARVDADGTRHLLSDDSGVLHLLVLEHAGGAVSGLKVEALGEISTASTLSYLDNRVVFVGSNAGNSQLIRLHPAPIESGSFIEVLESFPGMGPITDFAVVDLERQGQAQVVTCSGMGKDGSLRVVRNGVGINEQAAVELAGIKGMWSLRARDSDVHDTFLVVTFISETRVLAISEEDELDETDVPGFDSGSQTLLCANTSHNQLLQVTPTALFLVDASSRQQVATWAPPPGVAINVAAADAHQVLLGLGGGNLVHLEVGVGQLREVAHRQLAHEISCVDCHALGSASAATLAAVGLWNNTVLLLTLPELGDVVEERLSAEAIPRSVLLATFEGAAYLLAGLGDGQLFTFALDASSGALSDRKTLSVGTQPITLRPFRSKSSTHAFAASDRPTVIYSLNHKLLFSNVNLREVNHMCPFNSASFPDSLALASEDTLIIGTIDEIQKLHIRTVPLGEQPRRIAHQDSTRTFLVGCLKPSAGGGAMSDAEEVMACSLRLLDDQTFDTRSTFPLGANEDFTAVLSTLFAEDTRQYFVVGTAFILPDEPEPSSGRLLVFAVEEGALVLKAEKALKGTPFNLNAFAGKLLVGVHNKVVLYRWVCGMDDSHKLESECSFATHILALKVAVRGELILVGDLMKSASLLVYKAEEGRIEEHARDCNSAWTTAVECVDDDTFVLAENENHLLLLRKNGEAATDEERHRLEVAGEFHLGEFVNCFRHGSLVMRLPDSDLARIPTMLYGTINGVLGVLAFLPADQYAYLTRLQGAMCSTVQGVGGLSWAAWRDFSNGRRTSAVRGFVDGDLVESFLDLKREHQEDVAARVQLSVEELVQRVEELTRLH